MVPTPLLPSTAVAPRASTSSGVAGALSGGDLLYPDTDATASLIAWNTEIASISGGSPTAFERWMVSSTFSPRSQSCTRKSAGHVGGDRDLVGGGRMRHQPPARRSTTAPRS